jgi:predicted GH43/DUF377 family glycosyl hydrolase
MKKINSFRTHLPAQPIAVEHAEAEFRPDCRRVITKPFIATDQAPPMEGLLVRILSLDEADVSAALEHTIQAFVGRHANLGGDLQRHFDFVSRDKPELKALSRNRRLLIGAYYTNEFSVEAASLTNPSIVAAPDQSGLASGSMRYILSLRAIGEGHVSSIEFRSGILGPGRAMTVDPVSRFAAVGEHSEPLFDKTEFCAKLNEMKAWDETAGFVVDQLPDRFNLPQLEAVVAATEGKPAHLCKLSDPTTRAMHWLAKSTYEVTFPTDSDLSERVIFPWAANESHGLEDARFVRFTHDDGTVNYYATFTAYDGFRILPQLIETTDFVSFRVSTLSGPCAENKGAALFPRKINGRYYALSRFDAESSYVMQSYDLEVWEAAKRIESPENPWDLARVGNCGSPIETDAGWLVITHGVGPLRVYSLGAILLDINDPSRLIGCLRQPLLSPSDAEREGYVPNVVYSCGSMIHGNELILPYGVADTSCRIAKVPLDQLLANLVASQSI